MSLAAATYQVHFSFDLPKIDAIARAEIQDQFIDAVSDRIKLSEASFFHAVNAINDSRHRLCVKSVEPLSERLFAIFVLTRDDLTREDFQSSTRRRLRVK